MQNSVEQFAIDLAAAEWVPVEGQDATLYDSLVAAEQAKQD